MSDAVRFDLPTIEPESAEYWAGMQRGELLLRRCEDCGEVHHYPRPFCPSCWSERVAWQPASGAATLYTHSTVYVNDLPPFGEHVPYVAAVVDLAEGPRMMTQVVDCDPADLEIGMALQVVFRAVTDEITIAVFRPA